MTPDRVTVTDTLPEGPTDLPAPSAVADDLARQAGKAQAFDALTVRDVYAAFALAGVIASHTGETSLPDDDKAAKWAFGFADAMLKRRRSA